MTTPEPARSALRAFAAPAAPYAAGREAERQQRTLDAAKTQAERNARGQFATSFPLARAIVEATRAWLPGDFMYVNYGRAVRCYLTERVTLLHAAARARLCSCPHRDAAASVARASRQGQMDSVLTRHYEANPSCGLA
jgi:hypothetical protein